MRVRVLMEFMAEVEDDTDLSQVTVAIDALAMVPKGKPDGPGLPACWVDERVLSLEAVPVPPREKAIRALRAIIAELRGRGGHWCAAAIEAIIPDVREGKEVPVSPYWEHEMGNAGVLSWLKAALELGSKTEGDWELGRLPGGDWEVRKVESHEPRVP